MKRNPRKVKWTKAYRKLAGKELAEVWGCWGGVDSGAKHVVVPSICCTYMHLPQDATFEMERRRNCPEKYNRETVAKTVEAMKKIDAIRTRRQERYWEARMAAAKAQKQAWMLLFGCRVQADVCHAHIHTSSSTTTHPYIQQAAERKELEQQIHLVKAPLAQKQEAEKLRVAVEERQEHAMQE